MENILRERRLCWLGNVMWMDRQCISQQALYWRFRIRRGPGRTRTNWRFTVRKDMETGSHIGRGRRGSHQLRRMASECDSTYY